MPLKIVDLLKMNKIKNLVKALNIFFILILLSSCDGYLNLNNINKKDPLINSQKSKSKDKLEITISCEEENIAKYIKDGWKIKNKKSKEKVCSWKSIPANNTCNIEKDKGCKIIQPDVFGTETIYFLEK